MSSSSVRAPGLPGFLLFVLLLRLPLPHHGRRLQPCSNRGTCSLMEQQVWKWCAALERWAIFDGSQDCSGSSFPCLRLSSEGMDRHSVKRPMTDMDWCRGMQVFIFNSKATKSSGPLTVQSTPCCHLLPLFAASGRHLEQGRFNANAQQTQQPKAALPAHNTP